MGDRYQPPVYRGRPPNGRDERFSSYDRYDRYDDREDYYDRLRRQPPPDRYDDRQGGGFTFRGAANNDSYRPRREHEDFTFRAPGSATTRFPSPDRHAPPPQKPRRRPAEESHSERGGRGKPRGRGGKHGERAFTKAWPAHSRNIVNELGHRRRGSTPEQLSGMNVDGQSRFMVVDSSDSDDDDRNRGTIDLTNDDSDLEEGEVDDVPRKRVKTNDTVPQPAPATKWSNAEYLTALPPPETEGIAPKKNILDVIRKAKVESAPKTEFASAVKENADFVSFEFGDDDVKNIESEADDWPPSHASAAPSTMKKLNGEHPPKRGKFPVAPPSHMTDSYDLDMSDSVGSPPRPPPGLVMPTDAELAARYSKDVKGKKRKREEQSQDVGGVSREWREDDSDPTPWCTTDHSATEVVALRLHKEICDFFDFVRPHDHEIQLRRELIQRVQRSLRNSSNMVAARDVDVRSFGSFASGLYLPTADMDLVAVSSSFMRTGVKSYCQTKSQIYKLGRQLSSSGLAAPDSVNTIVGARVPIVKLTDKVTGIKIDISFESDSGVRANSTVLAWKEQYPDMPVIVALVKQMLAMRELNDVALGGLGGFSIICLVTSMMQMMPDREWDDIEPVQRYGELLMKFLDFYGNQFDVTRTGITMNPPGHYDKRRDPKRAQNAQRLTIINPNDPNHDIAGGSRHIGLVFDCFRSAHAAIQRRLAQVDSGKDIGESILRCVWGGNYSSFVLLRNNLYRLHNGQLPAPPPKQSSAPKFGSFQGKPQKKQKLDKSFVPGGTLNMQHPLPARPGRTSGAQSGDEPSKAHKKYVDLFVASPVESSPKHHIYSSMSEFTDAGAGETAGDGRDTDKRYLASAPETKPNFNMGFRRSSPIIVESDVDDSMTDAPLHVGHEGNTTIDLIDSDDASDCVSSLGAETLFEIGLSNRPPTSEQPQRLQRSEATARKRFDRVKVFKQEHPEIPDVPEQMSAHDLKLLREKHGLPRPLKKKQRMKLETARARANDARRMQSIQNPNKQQSGIDFSFAGTFTSINSQPLASAAQTDESLAMQPAALPESFVPAEWTDTGAPCQQPSTTDLTTARVSGEADNRPQLVHASDFSEAVLGAPKESSFAEQCKLRARDFQTLYPEVSVPSSLTKQGLAALKKTLLEKTELEPKADRQERALAFKRVCPEIDGVPNELSKEEFKILSDQIKFGIYKQTSNDQVMSFTTNDLQLTGMPDELSKESKKRSEQLKQTQIGPGFELIDNMTKRAAIFKQAYPGMAGVPDQLSTEEFEAMRARALSFKQMYPSVNGVPDRMTKEEFKRLKKSHRLACEG